MLVCYVVTKPSDLLNTVKSVATVNKIYFLKYFLHFARSHIKEHLDFQFHTEYSSAYFHNEEIILLSMSS